MRCRKCGSIIPNGMYQCTECNAFGDFMSEKQERIYNRILFFNKISAIFLIISILLFTVKIIYEIIKK